MFLDRNPNLVANLAPPKPGYKWRFLLSALNEDRLRRVLGYMLDENEFLSPHGIRSISKIHEDHPYVLRVDSQEYDVSYQPAESESGLFFWRDLILFYEYFHGDHGAGIGASYQTGWTGLVARLILLSVGLDPKQLLDLEHKPVLRRNVGIRSTAAAGKP